MAKKPKEKKIPCIFGAEIHEDCPVRKELGRPDISRWIKPKDETIEDIANVVTSMIKIELTSLAPFCKCCPFLAKKKLENRN